MQALSEIRFFNDPELAQIKRFAIPLSNIFGFETPYQKLTVDQLTIRRIALDLFSRETESLEPLFKDISGKFDKEWAAWWNEMAERSDAA
jgi:hypothetical protein